MKYSVLAAVLFFLICKVIAATIVKKHLFTRTPDNEYSYAAIALRDDVPGYQKMATKFFTLPNLKKMYHSIFYLDAKEDSTRRKSFVSALYEAHAANDSIDIFVLAHSNNVVSWLDTISNEIKNKIRLVYNCGCGNYWQGNDWVKNNAKYYIGHLGQYSYSPVFYFFFIKKWVNGWGLQRSLNSANRKTMLTLRLLGQSKTKAIKSCGKLW